MILNKLLCARACITYDYKNFIILLHVEARRFIINKNIFSISYHTIFYLYKISKTITNEYV